MPNPITLTLTAVLVAVVMVMAQRYYDVQADTRAAQHDYVYAICEHSRTQIEGSTEQRCADAQDANGIEFLCTMRNSSTTNHCWTEDNHQLGRN